MTWLRGFLRAVEYRTWATSRAKSLNVRRGTDTRMPIAYSLPMVSRYGVAVSYNLCCSIVNCDLRGDMTTVQVYVLWFNFILGLNVIFFCFGAWQCMIMSLTLSLPEYLMEVCKVTLTFESVDEILWCDHSNETSLSVLTHGAICFSKFDKMKFGNLVEIFLWLHLAVKGLKQKKIKI